LPQEIRQQIPANLLRLGTIGCVDTLPILALSFDPEFTKKLSAPSILKQPDTHPTFSKGA
jgi:hypothetical protein